MTLYIIGNGFDIAHHIKCKYCNFADFLGDNYPDYYESIMSGYCSSNALWKDFENELPSCATHIEEFGSQMGNEMRDQLDYDPMDDMGIGIWLDDQYKFLNELPIYLRLWVESIDTKKDAVYKINKDSVFLTFNYTDTLESVYRIDPDMNPSTNNAFGSVGFIGNSSAYGEQWLYSRLDYSRIPEIMDKRIHKAVLHMPKLNQSKVEFSAYKVSARFCSFGSNWDNKIPGETPVSDSASQSGYQSLDFTSLLVDGRTKTITKSEGLILKPKIKGSGFSVIATGDSYLAPQIMEINFR